MDTCVFHHWNIPPSCMFPRTRQLVDKTELPTNQSLPVAMKTGNTVGHPLSLASVLIPARCKKCGGDNIGRVTGAHRTGQISRN